MTVYNVNVQEEIKVKCLECEMTFFALSEYADCECGGYAVEIKPFEAIYELPYEVELGLV